MNSFKSFSVIADIFRFYSGILWIRNQESYLSFKFMNNENHLIKLNMYYSEESCLLATTKYQAVIFDKVYLRIGLLLLISIIQSKTLPLLSNYQTISSQIF